MPNGRCDCRARGRGPRQAGFCSYFCVFFSPKASLAGQYKEPQLTPKVRCASRVQPVRLKPENAPRRSQGQGGWRRRGVSETTEIHICCRCELLPHRRARRIGSPGAWPDLCPGEKPPENAARGRSDFASARCFGMWSSGSSRQALCWGI
jgi:hypothetical protein